MHISDTLANIEETLSSLVHQLADAKMMDEASEMLDIAVLVHRLQKKVQAKN
jgi:hypothetical protein